MAHLTKAMRALLASWRSKGLTDEQLKAVSSVDPELAAALRAEQQDAREKNAPAVQAIDAQAGEYLVALDEIIAFVLVVADRLTELGSTVAANANVTALVSRFSSTKQARQGSSNSGARAEIDWALLVGKGILWIALNGVGKSGKPMASWPVYAIVAPESAGASGRVYWKTDAGLQFEETAVSKAVSTTGRLRAPEGSDADATHGFVTALYAAAGVEVSGDDVANARALQLSYAVLDELGDPEAMRDDADALTKAFARRSSTEVAAELVRF